jgi:hypothetical protein
MTLGNMRQLVQNLLASCLNDARRHVALIDVSNYRKIPTFRGFARARCSRSGSRGNKIATGEVSSREAL